MPCLDACLCLVEREETSTYRVAKPSKLVLTTSPDPFLPLLSALLALVSRIHHRLLLQPLSVVTPDNLLLLFPRSFVECWIVDYAVVVGVERLVEELVVRSWARSGAIVVVGTVEGGTAGTSAG